jgi:hypothetical protein
MKMGNHGGRLVGSSLAHSQEAERDVGSLDMLNIFQYSTAQGHTLF